MTLDIGFAVDIESETVTKLVEHLRLRIMRGPYGVDVVFLHKPEVLEHPFAGHIVAGIRVCLVEIHTFELDRGSIHEEEAILDLKTSESYIK